jgi:hypothetical protein
MSFMAERKWQTTSKEIKINITICLLIYLLMCALQILTYLLTPWSRVLLEKLSGSAASPEIPHIFGT